jgi:cytoskeleton protein RodZ
MVRTTAGATAATVTPTPGPTSATLLPDDGIPVVLHVLDKTYVNVVVDGTKVMEAILERGDDQAWAFKRTFAIRVGNAGGAQITLNGVDLPPLGKAGEVLTIEYDAENLPLN